MPLALAHGWRCQYRYGFCQWQTSHGDTVILAPTGTTNVLQYKYFYRWWEYWYQF